MALIDQLLKGIITPEQQTLIEMIIHESKNVPVPCRAVGKPCTQSPVRLILSWQFRSLS